MVQRVDLAGMIGRLLAHWQRLVEILERLLLLPKVGIYSATAAERRSFAARVGHIAPDRRGLVVETQRLLSPPEMAVNPADIIQNLDRKSTRLNSSHLGISYAVFCLKKKKKKQREQW